MAIKFLSGLNLSGITTGSLLKLDSNGDIVAAVAGTDYAASSSTVWSTSGSNPTTAYYNGRVRVGTYQASVEASAKLHVFEYQTTDPKLLIEDGNTGDASMQFKISTQSYVMGIDNSDSDKFKLSASTAFGTSDVLTISSGNVGIGTTSPSYKFQITEPDYARLSLHQSTTGAIWQWGNDGSNMYAYYSNTAVRAIDITNNGNVGIGTTSPSQKLHVVGKGLFTDFVRFNGTTAPDFPVDIDSVDGGKVLRSTRGTSIFRIDQSNDGPGYIGMQSDDDLSIQTNNTSKVYITSSGNVGIGTTSPLVALDVRGTAIITNSAGNNYNENLRLPQATSGYAALTLGGSVAASGASAAQWTILKYPTNNDFAIRNNGSDRLYITTSGTVKLLAYGAGLLKTNASGEVSLDTNTYLTTTSASSTYLPLTGGTVANGNTAIPLTISRTSATTQQVGIRFLAADGESEPVDQYFGAGTDAEPYWSTTANLSTGSMIWHEGNDGDGSGLDADTLDGNHASAFALAAHTHSYLPLSGGTLTGTLTLSGERIDSAYDMFTGNNTNELEASKTIYGNINFKGVTAQNNGSTGTTQQGITWQINNYGSAGTDYGNQAQIVVGNNGSVGTFMGFFTSDNYSYAPSERLRIQANGNVGIGTTSPSYKLHAKTDSATWGYRFENNTGDEDVHVFLAHGGGYGLAVDSTDNSSSTYLLSLKGGTGGSGLGTVEHFRVTSAGNVGIGTNSPGHKLEVNGTTRLGTNATSYTRFGTYGVLLSTDTHILHNMYYNNAWYQIDNTLRSSTIHMGKSNGDDTIKFGYAAAGSTTWNYNHTFLRNGDYTAANDVNVGGILYTATVKTTNAATVIDNSGIQPDQGTVEDIVKFKWSGTQVASVDTGGYVNATGFKTSGTTGFLKSDGSVDTSSYISSIPSEYVTDTELTTALGSYLTTSSFNSAVAFVLNGTDVTIGDNVTLGSAAFSATTDFVAVSGDTMTGQLLLSDATASTGLYITSNTTSGNGSVLRLNKSAADRQVYQSFESDTLYLGVAASQTTVADVGTKGSVSLDLKTNYTTRMRIGSNGDVSVGSTNAWSKFTVYASSHSNGISVSRQADNTAALYIGNDGGSTPIIASNNADLVFGRDFSGTFTERMRMTNGGNFGIGTGSPAAALDVQTSSSTTSPTIRLGSTDASTSQVYGMIATYDAYHGVVMRGIPSAAGTYGVSAGDQMSFFEYGGQFRFYKKTPSVLSEVARIDSTSSFFNSNVGIGTTTPSYKLDVNGSTRISGILRTTDPVFVNNRSGLSVAHWSASGNTTGAIRITLPGSHTGNWSMLVLRITAYEYSGNRHCVYYVSGHDWTSGWYNYNVTKIGKSDKDIKLGYDSTANKDYVVIGGTSSSWSYGHVTVDVVAHPSFYSGNMDITSGWDIRQTTDLSGITLQTTNNDQVWDSGNDGSGSGLDADTVDGIQASSFLRSNADDAFSGNLTSASTGWIKFYHANETDTNDGKIGSGVFASGLNIVGTQTTAGTGRQVRIWGSLIDSSGNAYATQSYVSTAIANLVDQAPQALDTLSELAAALGDDAAFSTTVSTALGNRLRIDTNAQNLTATEKSNAYTNLDLANNFLPLSGVAVTVNGTDYAPGDELGAADLLAVIKTVDGSTSGLDADLLDGNHASAFASSGFLTNTGGAKIEVQNATDGGTGKGIYMWTSTDTNWVIYMGQAGASLSAAGNTAASGIDGRTSHAIRFRVNNSASQIGFLWENSSEDALMQLTGDTGHLYTKGRVYTSDQTTNYVDSTRISNWQTAYGWGNHSTQGYLTSTFGGDVTAQNINPAADTTYDLGRDGGRWRIVYCETLDSAGIHEANLANKKTGLYATGTVLVWKDGQAIPSTSFADYMKIGIAVYGNSSPLVHGAEPVLCTGQVEEGDYLVTSTETGHAMALTRQEVRERNLMDCVIGKALESGDGKSHLIKTWLTI